MANAKARPWISGIVDTLVGAHVLMKTAIPHRNRLAVILIDSAFETACRAYVHHVAKVERTDAHRHRDNLVKAARGLLKGIDKDVWENINFYYTEIRNDLYHVTASKTVTDIALLDYLDAVEFVIHTAFGIPVGEMVTQAVGSAQNSQRSESQGDELAPMRVPELRGLSADLDKVVIAVHAIGPNSVHEINEFFKEHGDRLRLKPAAFTSLVARNSGSKRFFFYSRADKAWKLSSLGKYRLAELSNGDQSNG